MNKFFLKFAIDRLVSCMLLMIGLDLWAVHKYLINLTICR